MIVKSFIDVYLAKDKEYIIEFADRQDLMWRDEVEGYIILWNTKKYHCKIDSELYDFYAEFLNQKFSPEMIEKYFDSWENNFINWYAKDGWNYIDFLFEPLGVYTVPLSETINGFIIDCQRAEISLIWRQHENTGND